MEIDKHFVQISVSSQNEVLHDEETCWQELSLLSALRDLDEEEEVTYSTDDLKERF